MTNMYGADSTELRALSASMRSAGNRLRLIRSAVEAAVTSARWAGPDADRFAVEWSRLLRTRLMATADLLDAAADATERNASEQHEASSATGAGGDARLLPSIALDRSIVSQPADTYAVFGAAGTGTEAVVEAFWATGDGRRADRDEIEIRQLDNGRYVVVLPGVTDLSDNLDGFARGIATGDASDVWYDNDEDTVRKMRYAISAATNPDFQDPYARVVRQQMEAAGIPPGADVMLIGHSYGAYAAMDLAGDDGFNSADGTSAGYHVNITHVLAAGADADWRFADIPGETETLLVNNRYDPAVAAENAASRHGNHEPVHGTHVERVYNGYRWDVGENHHSSNYVDGLAAMAADHDDVGSFMQRAGDLYNSSGSRYSVRVPDPLLASRP